MTTTTTIDACVLKLPLVYEHNRQFAYDGNVIMTPGKSHSYLNPRSAYLLNPGPFLTIPSRIGWLSVELARRRAHVAA